MLAFLGNEPRTACPWKDSQITTLSTIVVLNLGFARKHNRGVRELWSVGRVAAEVLPEQIVACEFGVCAEVGTSGRTQVELFDEDITSLPLYKSAPMDRVSVLVHRSGAKRNCSCNRYVVRFRPRADCGLTSHYSSLWYESSRRPARLVRRSGPGVDDQDHKDQTFWHERDDRESAFCSTVCPR